MKSRLGRTKYAASLLFALKKFHQSPEPIGATAVAIEGRDEDKRLRVQRTWLWNMASERAALVLSFAAAGQSLDASPVPGTEIEAEVVFYPSAYPLRALVKPLRAARALPALPGYASLAEAGAAYAQALARVPWLARLAAPLRAVTPLRLDGAWWVRDAAGQGWPLAQHFAAPWELLALSGRHPKLPSGV